MAKSFTSTGCFPKSIDLNFVPYSSIMHEQRGTIKIKPTGTTDEFPHDLNKLSFAECLALAEEIENDRITEEENKRTKIENNDDESNDSDDESDDSDDEM